MYNMNGQNNTDYSEHSIEMEKMKNEVITVLECYDETG